MYCRGRYWSCDWRYCWVTGYIGHVIGYIGHVIGYIVHVIGYIVHVTGNNGHVTGDTDHEARDLGHVTGDFGHVTSDIDHVTGNSVMWLEVVYCMVNAIGVPQCRLLVSGVLHCKLGVRMVPVGIRLTTCE